MVPGSSPGLGYTCYVKTLMVNTGTIYPAAVPHYYMTFCNIYIYLCKVVLHIYQKDGYGCQWMHIRWIWMDIDYMHGCGWI